MKIMAEELTGKTADAQGGGVKTNLELSFLPSALR